MEENPACLSFYNFPQSLLHIVVYVRDLIPKPQQQITSTYYPGCTGVHCITIHCYVAFWRMVALKDVFHSLNSVLWLMEIGFKARSFKTLGCDEGACEELRKVKPGNTFFRGGIMYFQVIGSNW